METPIEGPIEYATGSVTDIDDAPDGDEDRLFLARSTESERVQVVGFLTGTDEAALAAARKADPVDLALVDVYLPDGSGVDFVRELNCDAFVLSAA